MKLLNNESDESLSLISVTLVSSAIQHKGLFEQELNGFLLEHRETLARRASEGKQARPSLARRANESFVPFQRIRVRPKERTRGKFLSVNCGNPPCIREQINLFLFDRTEAKAVILIGNFFRRAGLHDEASTQSTCS